MIRTVMGNRQFFYVGTFGHFHRLFPAAVAPALESRKFFRRVVAIVNQKIRPLGKIHDSFIDLVAMFDIRTEYHYFPINPVNSIAVSITRVLMFADLKFATAFGYKIFFGYKEEDLSAHAFKRDGKKVLLHLRFEYALDVFSVTLPADGGNDKPALWIVGRFKKWQALNVVPVKMGKAKITMPVDTDVGIPHHLFAKIPDPCAGIKNNRSFLPLDQDTGRISPEFLVFWSTRWN